MAQQMINLGEMPNGMGGDTNRSANVKCNENFTELYETKARNGKNSDITSLEALTTPLSVSQGGTGATTAANARELLEAAKAGSNQDITALNGLSTPLSIQQGGTGCKTTTDVLKTLGLLNSTVTPAFASLKAAQGVVSNINTGQGLYLGWNESGGTGEGNFICNKGHGRGGFSWRTINIDNTATGPGMYYSFEGNLSVPGSVSQASDRRLKINDVEITNGLEKILKIRPVEYDRRSMIEDEEYPFHEAGMIAQELFKVLPIVVTPGGRKKMEDPIWRVNYTGIIPYLISAIKELKQQVDALRESRNESPDSTPPSA
ncbi:tail fiber domain-containing protein [Pseudomonas alliivorans]|nr:tail fiber domain-containing protein [Pseudomonas alliivorans]MEE4703764.1 tail fiber domain-containing protein [Pseudomonas alliivorans]MEE4739738.1 tail fiber domain-containing protein [Pseudomonas alliivorans]MEE4740615.1 tail fiber domain-containing protein [Pseudomonas alliivorans]